MKSYLALLIILFVLLSASPPFAKIHVTPSPPKTSFPREFVTHVFTLVNRGRVSDVFDITVSSPAGWNIVSNISPVELAPNEERKIPVTIFVPQDASSDKEYKLILKVTSNRGSSVMSQAEAITKIKYLAKVKILTFTTKGEHPQGGEVMYSFLVVNRGNGTDKFKIEMHSSLGWKARVDKEVVELSPGGRENVLVTLQIPKYASAGTRHSLRIRVVSTSNDEVSDEVNFITTVLPRRIDSGRICKTLPSKIKLEFGGVGSRDFSGQADFSCRGNLLGDYWLNFRLRERFEKKYGETSIDINTLKLGFGGAWWRIGLGDVSARFPRLTGVPPYGRGIKFQAERDNFNTTFLIKRQEWQRGSGENFMGLDFQFKAGEASTFGLTYIDRRDRNLLSVSASWSPFGSLTLDGEYAKSFRGGEKDGKLRFGLSLNTDKLSFNTKYYNFEPTTSWENSENRGYTIFGRYSPIETITLWSSISSSTNSSAKRIGSSFILKNLPSISLSYSEKKNRWKNPSLSFGLLEKRLFSLRTFKSFSSLFFSLGCEYGKSLSERSGESTLYGCDVRMRGHKGRFSGNLRFGGSGEFGLDGKRENVRGGIEFKYQFIPQRLSASVALAWEEKEESFFAYSTKRETTSFMSNITWKFGRSSTLNFNLGKNTFGTGKGEGEWQAKLSYNVEFDTPIPWIKTKGRVKGVVFLDKNSNGRVDHGERRFQNIIVRLGGNQIATDEVGRFTFPALTPGEYELDILRGTLPADLSPTFLPKKINLSKGETLDISIPLVKMSRIEGMIFEDRNKNGKKDPEEQGIPVLRVVLMKDGIQISEAYSNKCGKYCFTDLLPGEYKVVIDEEWIPKGYRLIGERELLLFIHQGIEENEINFRIIKRKREIIIRTFPKTIKDNSDSAKNK